MDARGVVQLFGHFLTYLEEQVSGKGIDVKTLKWGDETPRLAPSSIIVALEAAGLPLSLDSPAKPAPSTAADAAPPAAPVRSYSSDRIIVSDGTAGLIGFIPPFASRGRPEPPDWAAHVRHLAE